MNYDPLCDLISKYPTDIWLTTLKECISLDGISEDVKTRRTTLMDLVIYFGLEAPVDELVKEDEYDVSIDYKTLLFDILDHLEIDRKMYPTLDGLKTGWIWCGPWNRLSDLNLWDEEEQERTFSFLRKHNFHLLYTIPREDEKTDTLISEED